MQALRIDELRERVHSLAHAQARTSGIRTGHPVDPFAADWIGQFYAYYQLQTGERSRDIVKCMPLRMMRAAYPGLHDLDMRLAVERMERNVVQST